MWAVPVIDIIIIIISSFIEEIILLAQETNCNMCDLPSYSDNIVK